ncbi:unnamed protein product [Lymnaea stagnalis]|uniref:G-protein coupled receptors family 1 profile domain-containing protein n=1 Tax=Lymnaea stagnalis TaxID=6523 RepID=A0AAV2IKT6_LYMST
MTNGEIWLVSAISVERFVAVWFPFQVARIFTPPRVKGIVVAVVLLTLAVMSPAVFTFTYAWVYDETLNATVAKLLLTDFYKSNYDAVNFVCYVVYNIALNGIPWLLVVFCGISTGIKVVHTGNLRKRLVRVRVRNGKTPTGSKKSHRDNANLDLRVVKMLGLVGLFSTIVFVPTMLLDLYSYYVPNFIYQSKLYSALVICIDLLYTLNASGNFLIYASVSNKFFKTYLAIFRQCRVMK